MDPNAALAAIRQMIDEEEKDSAKIAGAFLALDEWLTRGGFLPKSWQPYGEVPRPWAVMAEHTDPLGPPNPAGAELPGPHEYYENGQWHE